MIAWTATPLVRSVVQGTTVTAPPNLHSGAAALLTTSIRLFDGTGTVVTGLTVPAVGTFTADTSNGRLVFSPLGGFVGTTQVTYVAQDTNHEPSRTTFSVTVTPLRLSVGNSTVDTGALAHLPVTGPPNSATITVPAPAAGASALSYSAGTLDVHSVAGFSGRIRIRVTATNGSASLVRTGIVTVRPAPPSAASFHVVDGAQTLITWAGPPSLTPLTYQVTADGRVLCRTRSLTCQVPTPLGPATKISLRALGGEAVASRTVTAAYAPVGCGQLTAVYFDSDSAVLSPATRHQLDALARTLKAQGFKQSCLVGYTDSRADSWYNLFLSQRRVAAVTAYLRARTTGIHYEPTYSGESAPVASNLTPTGRAANRRVEIGVA